MPKLRDHVDKLVEAKPKGWKIFRIVVAVLVIIILIACIAGGGSSDEETTTSDLVEGTNISQDAAEVACQDAEVTGATAGYTVIKATDYNLQFWSAGSYDKDGNPISFAQWNGEDPDGATVRYTCYFSGADDESLYIIYVKAGDVDTWKSASDLLYAEYNADGEPYAAAED